MDNNEEKILRDTPLTEEDTSIEAADRGPEPAADTAGPETEEPSAVEKPEDSNAAAEPETEEPSAVEGPEAEDSAAEAGSEPEAENSAAEAEPEPEEPAAAGHEPEDAAPVDGPAEKAEETVSAPAGETGSAGRSFSGMLDDADSAASVGSAEDAPGQEDGEQNKPRKKHRIWIPILLILLLIGAAAGGYMYGVFYFRDRFIYNTKINGVVCGRLTPAETAERIGFRMEKYQMEITFRDNQKQTIKAAQIDYKFAPGDSIEKLLTKQDPYKWPLGIFQPVEYNVEEKTEYNHERATKLIEGFDQMKEENMVKPENAYMVLKDEGFSIVPEVEGNAVNTEPVTAAILAALDEDAASVNVEEIEGAYKEPSIRADNKELNEETDKLNGYIGADITYIVPEGDEEMRLNAKTLQTWLSVDDDGHYYKDEEVWADHIWNYVDQIAINVNTVADTRSFPATGIGTISVGGGDRARK